MSASKLMQGLKQKEIRELINDYEFTCHTIVTFENIVSFNISGNCSQGKKMKTSANNEIQANIDVTPDIVIEYNIPKLYETDGVSFKKKVIYEKWEIPQIGFYWLIAELDEKENLAYGFANLNDDSFAEWGYISLNELKENNVTKCHSWQPCTFEEAQRKMQQYRRERNL